MNLLTKVPPKTVKIGDEEWSVNWSHRVSVVFAELIREGELPQNEILYEGLLLYYPDAARVTNENVAEAVSAMLWFFECGRENTPQGDSGRAKRVLSYKEDSGYIYAAFLQQYGIDLTETDLHWWTFRALFDGLAKDTTISQIMGFRGMDIPPDMNKDQKAYYRRMKKIYALDSVLSSGERAFQDELTKTLSEGGNVAAVLEKYKE